MEENKMAGYRKLSRTSNTEKSVNQKSGNKPVYHGKIVTTEAKAKEIRKIAEGLIAMAVREKDNFRNSYSYS
jgi:large subunit ribosomal protein L17